MQLSSAPVSKDGYPLTSYPANGRPKLSIGSNNLPPPHPYTNGNRNHQHLSECHSNIHPYAGQFLPKKFVNNFNGPGAQLSTDSDSPSILLSTATVEDSSSNQERPSRWSRHRGRAKKRSPSARQRASASVIRHQDSSPPPIQRDRPPSPPRTEETMQDSPTVVLPFTERSEMNKKECPVCQPRYSQSPEKLGVRPILSKKMSVDSASLFVQEMMHDAYVNGKKPIKGCDGGAEYRVPKESRQERPRRARSEYRPRNNSRRRQTSPDINVNIRNKENQLISMDASITGDVELHRSAGYVRYPKNLKHFHDHQYGWSALNGGKESPGVMKHENQFLSLTPPKQHQTDLNGNEERSIEPRINDYEEPKQKTCKESFRKKFSVNGRSISKASKSRRHSRKGQQQNYQDDSLKSPGLIIHRDNSIVNTIDVSLQNNGGRKSSNISRSKSRSRFSEMFSNGLQTIWPAKAGIWLPQWYFGKIKRMEAEKKLLMPQNEHGAYLIRDSESRRNDYSLSVRDGDTVKHYRIRPLDEGGFFIARRTTFRTF